MAILQFSPRLQSRLKINSKQLADFCERWQVSELAFFGSVLRNEFLPDSDIDVLVSYRPTAKRGLFEKMQMQQELSDLLNRNVDLVSRNAIEKSNNWLRRKNILDSAELVYVA